MEFVKTCNWCPEQYDIMEDGKQVAYMKIKYGYCEVYVPNAGGKLVYLSCIKGRNEFLNNEERQQHFDNAIVSIENFKTVENIC